MEESGVQLTRVAGNERAAGSERESAGNERAMGAMEEKARATKELGA
jgi:hypothetical protein